MATQHRNSNGHLATPVREDFKQNGLSTPTTTTNGHTNNATNGHNGLNGHENGHDENGTNGINNTNEFQQQQQQHANGMTTTPTKSNGTIHFNSNASNGLNGSNGQIDATNNSSPLDSPASLSPNSIKRNVLNTLNKRDEPEQSRCNLTLVLHEKQRMELEQRPLPPKPKANEVTLATHTVGICGSDVKYWQQGKIGNFILTKPMILGHETSAIVIEVGDEVRSLKPGDKVAVEVGLPCSSCQLCRSGKYNLCTEMAFAATPPHDGTLTRYFNHPANFCFKLPEPVTLEEGALIEPLAVAVHACQRAPIKLNDVVLICGAGAVGLLSMLSAKAFGASHVIVTDISPNRLAFARQLGATATVLVEKNQSLDELSARIRQIQAQFKPTVDGVDVVLECSGAESSLNLAIQSAGVGAQIVCIGCQPDRISLSLNQAIMQEIDIKGVFRYRNCYPIAMSLVETGKINLRPLVTHRFRLEEAVQAFETCCRGEGVKIIIKCMDKQCSSKLL